jgi:two-component system chemotaxis response regulator CheY
MAKILLCDDNKMVLSFFERKLKELGFEIVAKAKDGDEGLQFYIANQPDLTLLDVTMPNKDGRECLDEILKVNTAAKVIMVSAISDEDVILACLARGAKGFIPKENLYNEEVFKTKVLVLIESVLKAA